MLLKILMFRFGPDPGLLNSAFRLLNTDLFGISTKQYAFFCYCENVKYAVVLFFTCNEKSENKNVLFDKAFTEVVTLVALNFFEIKNIFISNAHFPN